MEDILALIHHGVASIPASTPGYRYASRQTSSAPGRARIKPNNKNKKKNANDQEKLNRIIENLVLKNAKRYNNKYAFMPGGGRLYANWQHVNEQGKIWHIPYQNGLHTWNQIKAKIDKKLTSAYAKENAQKQAKNFNRNFTGNLAKARNMLKNSKSKL